MASPKPEQARKVVPVTGEDVERIARQIFWEEVPRLQREIYEGELKRLREAFEREFSRVWEAIGSLTEAQKRTEERVDALAEAQKRTEERLAKLTERVDALAEAQKRTEERLAKLTERVDALAEAQKRTEEQLAELTKAYKRLERRVDELAEAQRRTHEDVQELKKHYRYLSNIIGADLEVDAEEMLSWSLRQRGYTILSEAFIEETDGDIDVIMRVRDPKGQEYWALVEAKARLRRKEYLRWVRKLHDPAYVKKLRSLGYEPPWLAYMFGLRVYRDVLEVAREHGVGVLDVHGEQVQALPLQP